jgi:hypothetical protein
MTIGISVPVSEDLLHANQVVSVVKAMWPLPVFATPGVGRKGIFLAVFSPSTHLPLSAALFFWRHGLISGSLGFPLRSSAQGHQLGSALECQGFLDHADRTIGIGGVRISALLLGLVINAA